MTVSDPRGLDSGTFAANVYDPACPSRALLEHVTSRWGVLAVAALLDETLRFGELRRLIGGVSERMLAQTLQTLSRDGLVVRRAYAEVPPHVEYSLTARGKEAARLISELMKWVEDQAPAVHRAQQRHDADNAGCRV